MEKMMEIPGAGGSNAKPSGTENPVGWGIKLEKNLPWGGGGYGYFLEPHNENIKWGQICWPIPILLEACKTRM